jgi:hypothetical protein
MLHQQRIWNGPVFSEGGNHYYYDGLVTGSYADDRGYDLANDAWLVDFDLLKLHPLGCDIGLGNPGSFVAALSGVPDEKDWDRYFAGTIAFGHIGKFFEPSGKPDGLPVRSYFMLQQLQSSYARALVKEIRYADSNNRLLDVSSAVATGAYRRSQIRITYDNGLVVWVNGHRNEDWVIGDIRLPPSGYYAKDPDGRLIVFSGLTDSNHRVDMVHSEAYDYLDGRGRWWRTPWGGADGQLIILRNDKAGTREIIPLHTHRFAIALEKEPLELRVLDEAGRTMGTASGTLEDGLYYIDGTQGAFSYVLKLRK